MPTRHFALPLPVNLRQTLGELWQGRPDPCMRVSDTELVRSHLTADGPATLALRVHPAEQMAEAQAWGPGAQRSLAEAPALIGATDSLDGFAPAHRLVARAHRQRPGLRLGRSGRIADVLVRLILGQKVTSLEASRAWLGLVRAVGTPAPGPYQGMLVPPEPDAIAARPSWTWHRLGVERQRADVIRLACRRIERLEEALAMPRDAALERLTALPGLGPWTANLVLRVAGGDADAVEVGDYHVPNQVCWALAGEPRGGDARMLQLLAPYAGHRGRVVRLLGSAVQHAPAYGPRMPINDLRRLSRWSGPGTRAPRDR